MKGREEERKTSKSRRSSSRSPFPPLPPSPFSPSRALSSPRSDSTPRVLFAAGGTGGHVYPAIAIADAVRALAPGAAVAFAGTRERMEWEAVPRAGYEIHPVTASGFPRRLSPQLLALPFRLARGLAESLALVGRLDPDVVVGTGGYVAGPVGLAAALRRRPLVIQEQNAYAGATNKLLARLAARVFVAFEAAREEFPAAKTVVAGNPVRQDLVGVDAAEARAHFGIEDGQRVLLVMGGSLGAGPLNEALRRHHEALLADPGLVIIWQTGVRYAEALRRAVPEHPRLRLLPYLERMDYAYAVAELALCRAGAITCSELALTGTPAVLVPSPNVTADHQTKNARAMADEGAAVLLPEPELLEGLVPAVTELMEDEGRRASMQEAALRLARPQAARQMAEAVLELAGGAP